MTLHDLIEEFKNQNPHLAEQQKAYGQCDWASYKFIKLARTHGYEFIEYTFYASNYRGYNCCDKANPNPVTYRVQDSEGNLLRNESGATMCTWHCIVDAGTVLIDFTARQYCKDYAWPLIIPADNLPQIEKAEAAKAGA